MQFCAGLGTVLTNDPIVSYFNRTCAKSKSEINYIPFLLDSLSVRLLKYFLAAV